MRYMLMMQGTQANFAEFRAWPKEALKAHMEFMHRFNKELTDAGEFASGEGLAWPEDAKIVRAGKGGVAEVTDGPFPEAKEWLAGYWIVDVESEARAIELAAKASAAPGPDGEPLNIPIEVRAVPSGPPEDLIS